MQHSLQPYPEARFTPSDGKDAASPQPAPRQNRLLAALPPEDYERLLPNLEPVALPPGWNVHPAGDQVKHLYFPTAGIVSRLHVTKLGETAAVAITGREGVVGIASFLGGESTSSEAVVLIAGHAYRLRANLLKDEFEHGKPLSHLLLRYARALIVQIVQIAACYRHHSVEQQLCQWILSSLDRVRSNELAMTQELIADMLGVRREGITEAAGKLQKAGLIHYRRGHIAVPDRSQLELKACECYAVVKREHDLLLGQDGSSAH